MLIRRSPGREVSMRWDISMTRGWISIHRLALSAWTFTLASRILCTLTNMMRLHIIRVWMMTSRKMSRLEMSMTILIESWPIHSEAWHHVVWVWLELVRVLREAKATTWVKAVTSYREVASRCHHVMTRTVLQGAVALCVRR
jgi:hypothetical protein